jgi:hypothetical protein
MHVLIELGIEVDGGPFILDIGEQMHLRMHFGEIPIFLPVNLDKFLESRECDVVRNIYYR